jgi:hypothetical protein
LGDERDKN